jgi:hypothetical protein
MRFIPGVPFVKLDEKSKQYVVQTFYREIHVRRTNRKYTTFRYFAACRLFAQLSKGELPNWPLAKGA